jgi:hypothetical protein
MSVSFVNRQAICYKFTALQRRADWWSLLAQSGGMDRPATLILLHIGGITTPANIHEAIPRTLMNHCRVELNSLRIYVKEIALAAGIPKKQLSCESRS